MRNQYPNDNQLVTYQGVRLQRPQGVPSCVIPLQQPRQRRWTLLRMIMIMMMMDVKRMPVVILAVHVLSSSSFTFLLMIPLLNDITTSTNSHINFHLFAVAARSVDYDHHRVKNNENQNDENPLDMIDIDLLQLIDSAEILDTLQRSFDAAAAAVGNDENHGEHDDNSNSDLWNILGLQDLLLQQQQESNPQLVLAGGNGINDQNNADVILNLMSQNLQEHLKNHNNKIQYMENGQQVSISIGTGVDGIPDGTIYIDQGPSNSNNDGDHSTNTGTISLQQQQQQQILLPGMDVFASLESTSVNELNELLQNVFGSNVEALMQQAARGGLSPPLNNNHNNNNNNNNDDPNQAVLQELLRQLEQQQQHMSRGVSSSSASNNGNIHYRRNAKLTTSKEPQPPQSHHSSSSSTSTSPSATATTTATVSSSAAAAAAASVTTMSLQHKLQQQLEDDLKLQKESVTATTATTPTVVSATAISKHLPLQQLIQVRTVIDAATYYPKERQILIKIYNKLHGKKNIDAAANVELWKVLGDIDESNAYHCQWIGITCGTIMVMKSEITSATNQDDSNNTSNNDNNNSTMLLPYPMQVVQEINMTYFHFNGTIPGRLFSKLTYLQSIDLSYNRFLHGSVPFQELSKLQYLQSIHLQHNALTGTLPPYLFGTTDYNDSIDANRENIWFPNLVEFNVANNELTGTITIPNRWYLPKVQMLDVSDNFLTGSMIKIPCTGIDSSNSTNDDDAPKMIDTNADAKANATSEYSVALRFLIVSNNAITGTIPDFTTAEFPNLITMDLSCNLMTGLDATKVLPEIPMSLWDLLLFDNRLSGPFVNTMLWGSSYTNKGSTSLQLQILSLSNNQFTGRIPIDGWHKLRNLGALMINQNRFTGIIPVALLAGQATSLGLLDVSYNKLTGTIATEIALMNSLHTIDAMSNQLTGPIPNEMIHMNPNLRLNFTDNLYVHRSI